MKILLVSNMYPDDNNPNYGIFVKNQVKLLEEENYTIDLEVMYKSKNVMMKILSYFHHYFMVIYKYLFKSYDFVYVHYASLNSPPILLGNIYNKNQKIIVNIHGSDVHTTNSLQNKIDKLTRRLLEISTVIVVPSNYYKDLVTNKYDLTMNKIFVSPSGGIDRTIFYPNKKDNKNLTSGLIGYVGRIDSDKGWEDLIYAFENILNEQNFNHLKLLMVGEGLEVKKRDELLKELNLSDRVIIQKNMTHKELSEIYNKIDVLVFPSKRESLGLVGVEAMACGTPVIGSNIGGIKSYLSNKYNGILVEPSDSKSIADGIKEYYQMDNQKKIELSNNALISTNGFDKEFVRSEFIDMLKSV